jgi:hypothetical protein
MRLITIVAFLLLPVSVLAQTPVTGASKLAWTQAASSLAVANGYRYDAVIDTLPSVALLAVTCTGAASPYSCTGNFPAATPGVTHTITLATTDVSVTPALSSGPTAAISFRFVIAPATPSTLTIIP